MSQSKITLYKYIKLAEGSWRYCKSACYSNGKIKPNRSVVDGTEDGQCRNFNFLSLGDAPPFPSLVAAFRPYLPALRAFSVNADALPISRIRLASREP